MQLQAIPNSTREHLTNFRSVPSLLPATLHPALLMHDTTLDDTITDCLSDNIFSILLRVQVQFDANVAQRDAGVRKRETADARFDHILPEA
jgi:hypothetical protein